MKFIIYDKSREGSGRPGSGRPDSQIPWTGSTLVIGRRADADIRVDEPTMSGVHAKIYPASDGVRLRDLESLNGTHVNGERIVERLLRPGDKIRIGRVMIVVSGPSGRAVQEVTAAANPLAVAERRLVTTQTLKVSLNDLSTERLEEDHHILLLRNLFEGLESVADRGDVLAKVRDVLEQSFRRVRVFILRPDDGDAGGWRPPLAIADGRPPSLTFAAEAARSRSAILSSSMPDDERFARSDSARIAGIETAIAAPASCEGEPVAVLYVDRLGLPPFSRRDLHVLGIAANHVTAVLENLSRFEALRRANVELVEARESLAELNRNLEGLVLERTAEIQRQADEIGRLAAAKDELLGIAAHDIRGPLTVIQGTTELVRLRLGEIDRETLGRSLEMIHGACRGLTRLLGELLDAKAIESGKITLRKRRCPVRRLLEDTLPVARLAAEDKNVQLVVESDAGLALDADPRRLGQAITNLVLNAVKFSPSGTRIVLRGVAEGEDRARIEVEDQGIGIPEEELEGIFGTFEQGKAGRQFGGSGLGLMIAKRIVDLHGGELTVQSKVGVGTRFTLSLPGAGVVADELEGLETG